jgi:hypothetical protein
MIKNIALHILIIFLIFIYINNSASAQYSKNIGADSLLTMFESKEPFEVLDKITSIYSLNYKELYYNEKLKPHLLKWLDKEEYRKHRLLQVRKIYSSDSLWMRNKILQSIRGGNRESKADSIMNTPYLYNAFRDSVMTTLMNLVEKEYDETDKYPPDLAVRIHSRIAYPESYRIIYQWWKEKGGENKYFLPLVRMGDPEARKIYNQKISRVSKNKGKGEDLVILDDELQTEITPSFSVEKRLQLLNVNEKFIAISDDEEGQPYNCLLLKMMVDEIFYRSIAIDKSVKRNDTCVIHLKHLAEIKAAASKLIEKYKAEEHYWVQNMPFNKK